MINKKLMIIDLEQEKVHTFTKELISEKFGSQDFQIDKLAVDYPQGLNNSHDHSACRSPEMILVSSVENLYFQIPSFYAKTNVRKSHLLKSFRKGAIFDFKPNMIKGHYLRRKSADDNLYFLPGYKRTLLHIDKCKQAWLYNTKTRKKMVQI